MGFRIVKSKFNFTPSSPIMLDKEILTTDENGVTRSEVIRSEYSPDDDDIPSPSDYTLEAQLSSGVPLQQLNSVVINTQPTPSEVESSVNSIIGDASGDNANKENNN